MRVPPSEPYSRAAAAGGAMDAPRGYQRSMMQPHEGVWESSTATAGGGVVRSRRLPPGRGPGPSPGRGSYNAPGTARPSAATYREGGYEVGPAGGGAWPPHQQQQQRQHQQPPRRWRADGDVPSPSAEAPPPASRRRVSEWGDGRGGGWS